MPEINQPVVEIFGDPPDQGQITSAIVKKERIDIDKSSVSSVEKTSKRKNKTRTNRS